ERLQKAEKRMPDYMEREVLEDLKNKEDNENHLQSASKFIEHLEHNIEKRESHETVFTPNLVKDNAIISKIGRSLISRLFAMENPTNGYIDSRFRIDEESEKDDLKESTSYKVASSKLKLYLLSAVYSSDRPKVHPTQSSAATQTKKEDIDYARLMDYEQYVPKILEDDIVNHLKTIFNQERKKEALDDCIQHVDRVMNGEKAHEGIF
ncbi:hypothetical protein PFISCL1PPCAC_1599, partial [Pristionchus fissidentatus]